MPHTKASIIIPVYNEERSIQQLHREICDVLQHSPYSAEIIFVDDGSTDGTLAEIRKLHPVTAVVLAKHYGKSQALQAGLDHANGEFILTLDGDLQDDPADLPKFLERLAGGAQLVCGWRRTRYDPSAKIAVSRLANRIVQLVTGMRIHDVNCGFRGYTRAVAGQLRLTGDMHRYIPVLVHSSGIPVEELTVRHRPRPYGRSKYGTTRLAASFFDFATLLFLRVFADRPLHLFGMLGIFLFLGGSAILLYLGWVRIVVGEFIGHRPLLLLGILLFLGGLNLFSIGILGELMIRQAPAERRHFVIKETFHAAHPRPHGAPAAAEHAAPAYERAA